MEIIRVGINDKNKIKFIKEHCHTVCRKEIDQKWINECLYYFDYCYISCNENKIKGIITFQVNEFVEITLLCTNIKSKGLGRELLNLAIEYANNRKMECQLNSVPKARGFYLRCGFLKCKIDINKMPPENSTPMYFPFDWLLGLSDKASIFINKKKAYNDYIENCIENDLIPSTFEIFSS